MPKKPNEMMQVMQLRPPKLKDKPPSKSRITIPLKDTFGFIPEIIIIDKVVGSSGKIVISAILPKEMKEKNEDN